MVVVWGAGWVQEFAPVCVFAVSLHEERADRLVCVGVQKLFNQRVIVLLILLQLSVSHFLAPDRLHNFDFFSVFIQNHLLVLLAVLLFIVVLKDLRLVVQLIFK